MLDLRANGGGDLDTAMAVLGWLLGPEPVHISDVIAQDGAQRWHSEPRGDLAPGTPAAALIGPRTYSSGEALAYHFQAQGRGPLVGEGTPGAADHITPIVLDAHVRANLPRAYVVDAVTGLQLGAGRRRAGRPVRGGRGPGAGARPPARGVAVTRRRARRRPGRAP